MKQLLPISILLVSFLVGAQESIFVEARPLIHIHTREVQETALRLGNGVEVTSGFLLVQNLEVFAGFLWTAFDTDETFEESNVNYNERGFVLGVRWNIPIDKERKNKYYLRLSTLYTDLIGRSDAENLRVNTPYNFGFQTGVGMRIKSLGNWYVLPAFLYTYSNHQVTNFDSSIDINLSYVSVHVGIRRYF